MDEKLTKARLEATQRQIGLLEQCIVDSAEVKDKMDSHVYDAMMAGYNSILKELRGAETTYRYQLEVLK